MSQKIRLQKFLANHGIDSRRKCEKLILEGRVRLNGKIVTELGTTLDPVRDRVFFEGKRLGKITRHRTILFYKPRGYECTTSKEVKNIYELLTSIKEKLVTAGRLDKKSEGMLILSNDTDLIHRLTHPSFEGRKVYYVMVSGEISQTVMKGLHRGVVIDGKLAKAESIKILRPGEKPGRYLLEFILKEGRKRQIRQTCEENGLTVHRLARIQINGLRMRNLKPGQWRDLTQEELVWLMTKPEETPKAPAFPGKGNAPSFPKKVPPKNQEFRIQNSELKVHHSEFRKNRGSRTQNSESRIQNPELRSKSRDSRVQKPESRSPQSKFRPHHHKPKR